MKSTENKYTYSNPIGLTQQFRFCGNPLRVDMYRGCSFQCNYCFAKNHNGNNLFNCGVEMADPKEIEKMFNKAFNTTTEYADPVVDLMRHRVPFHCGGMSDPFQALEFKEHLTYKLIELSKKYRYPIVFSTKQCSLPEEYFNVLDPELHAFQVSLIGYEDDFIKKYEPNTPSPEKRIEFMKILKQKGFWVGMRVQPLIDIEQGLKVMKEVENDIDYITVEHLKIAMNDKKQIELFRDYMKDYSVHKGSRNFEMKRHLKEQNIARILKEITGCKIGIGDNDLHHLSQSKCCCGIDTIGGVFDNYLKYNTTYFCTSNCGLIEKETIYTPSGNVSGSFNSQSVIKGVTSFKDYVDNHCVKHLAELQEEGMSCELCEHYRNYFMNAETSRKFAEDKDQISIFDLFEE